MRQTKGVEEEEEDAEGIRQYRAINQEIKKGTNKAKMDWIEEQCQNIENNMKKNNSKKTYQLGEPPPYRTMMENV